MDPVARATGALVATRNLGFDTLIVDTAGRLHIDDELMAELAAIQAAVDPTDRLFVADAMTGQDAIRSAGEFNARAGVTGVVLTKLDGDARGGAALSVVGVVGVPIAFVGMGERIQDLEPFHADRLVSRLLGMGDVLSLIERAEQAIDADDRARLEEKTRLDDFTLENFRDQLRTIKKMGPLEQVLGMIPGFGAMKELKDKREQIDDRQLARVEAIINSMTPSERRNHGLINGNRRKRIARGSGTSVEEINRLLKQFVQMRKMLKMVGGATGGITGSFMRLIVADARRRERDSQSYQEAFQSKRRIPRRIRFAPIFSTPIPVRLAVTPVPVGGEKPILSRGAKQEGGEKPLRYEE
jgi:signal recognition particle subunit SRP54